MRESDYQRSRSRSPVRRANYDDQDRRMDRRHGQEHRRRDSQSDSYPRSSDKQHTEERRPRRRSVGQSDSRDRRDVRGRGEVRERRDNRDRRDDRERRDVRERRDDRERRDRRDDRDRRDSRGTREVRERRDSRGTREVRERRDSRGAREVRERRERRDSRGARDIRERRDSRDSKGGRERRHQPEDRNRSRNDSPRNGHSNSDSRSGFGHHPPRVEGASYSDKMNRNYGNSVFVGNLPYDCEARDLESYFSKVGAVIRADIVTHRGRHRGMGTVEFATRESVDDAIKELDHSNFMDREIFVREDNPPPASALSDLKREEGGGRSRARSERPRRGDDRVRDGRDSRNSRNSRDSRDNRDSRDSKDSRDSRDRRNSKDSGSQSSNSSRQPEGVEVFVANLPFSINWQALKDMFKKFGDVSRADISLDHMNRSRGFGTVYFKTAEEAEESINYYAGLEMEGRKLDCKKGRYGWTAHNRDLEADIHMGGDGDEQNYRANRNGDNHHNNLENTRVIDDFKDDGVNSSFVEDAIPHGEKSNIVYVSNLPLSTAQSDLYDLFDTIGQVLIAELKYENGEVNGDAVVKYADVDSAEMCISRLDKYVYGGCELDISYAGHREQEHEQEQVAESNREASPLNEDQNIDAPELENLNTVPTENDPKE